MRLPQRVATLWPAVLFLTGVLVLTLCGARGGRPPTSHFLHAQPSAPQLLPHGLRTAFLSHQSGSQFHSALYRGSAPLQHRMAATPSSAVSSDAQGDERPAIIICGAGIIGASIAYFLTQRGFKPVVVERTAVAAAAGGKGGGFLARDWGRPGVTERLHHTGFALHERLASTLGIKSYRRIPTLSITAGSQPRPSQLCSWLDGAIAHSSVLDRDGTAQVNPKEYTIALMNAAIANGAKLVIGRVEGMDTEEGPGGVRTVRAVIVDGKPMPAEKVVIAMGPWSVFATDWLGLPVPMEGVWSTSVVYNHASTERVAKEPFAMFCEEDGNGCHLEVYPRTSGEVYLCGVGGSKYMNPEQIKALAPEDVVADPQRVAAAHASFSNMSSVADQPPAVTQACMRPCLSDALPMMGLVPDTSNAYIATGHNCWGILWAPSTGLAMAELITDGRCTSLDLQPFSPARFGRPVARPPARGRQQGTVGVGEQW